MIKGVLGQPNFSPQTNITQLSPKLTQTLTTYHPLKLTQTYRVVLSWTNGTSLNFLGKRNRKFEFFVLCLFGEKSWVVPEPLLSYYSAYMRFVKRHWDVLCFASYLALMNAKKGETAVCESFLVLSAKDVRWSCLPHCCVAFSVQPISQRAELWLAPKACVASSNSINVRLVLAFLQGFFLRNFQFSFPRKYPKFCFTRNSIVLVTFRGSSEFRSRINLRLRVSEGHGGGKGWRGLTLRGAYIPSNC